MIISNNNINSISIIEGQNDFIKFKVAPSLGGKIISIYNRVLKKEFLWSNNNIPLNINRKGDDFDINFWGGIDELIPNDIPEIVDSIKYPDHGELWTTQLQYDCLRNKISVFGKLDLCGLFYKKSMFLEDHKPIIHIEYKIRNDSNKKRYFLWKLHAALSIEAGDKLETTAEKVRIVYPDESKSESSMEHIWPIIDQRDVSIVPPKNKTLDFFYLYGVKHGEMKFISNKNKHLFSYRYDKNIFPFQWYFASYGGFHNHYTAILEPSTGMPVSINESIRSGQAISLEPNEELNTVVSIYAGENNK